MPKKAALLLYHNLENINEDKSYWENILNFMNFIGTGLHHHKAFFMAENMKNIESLYRNILKEKSVKLKIVFSRSMTTVSAMFHY